MQVAYKGKTQGKKKKNVTDIQEIIKNVNTTQVGRKEQVKQLNSRVKELNAERDKVLVTVEFLQESIDKSIAEYITDYGVDLTKEEIIENIDKLVEDARVQLDADIKKLSEEIALVEQGKLSKNGSGTGEVVSPLGVKPVMKGFAGVAVPTNIKKDVEEVEEVSGVEVVASMESGIEQVFTQVNANTVSEIEVKAEEVVSNSKPLSPLERMMQGQSKTVTEVKKEEELFASLDFVSDETDVDKVLKSPVSGSSNSWFEELKKKQQAK